MGAGDAVLVLGSQVVAAVDDWWKSARSGIGSHDCQEVALSQSWRAFSRALESEVLASVFLPLAAPGPSWWVPAPSLSQPEYVRVHMDVTIDDPDRERIADILGLEDTTEPGFLSDAAALVGEYGWDIARCTGLALRIANVDTKAWWYDGTDRGAWRVDVEALQLDAGTRIADPDATIARLAAALEDYVVSERSRLALDGQVGYWEAVVAAQARASELAALVDAIDADAWSRGVASPMRAAILPGPPVEIPSRAAETKAPDGVRLHISADAVVMFESDPTRGVDTSSVYNGESVVEWLRANAWRPPSGPGLPTCHVNVTVEPARPHGTHESGR